MDQLKPVATTSHGSKKVFIHPALKTCSHVFVRHDAVKNPLQTPYDGPYLVLKRTEKMFTIEKNGKHSTINIDRLKPAFFENSHHSSAPIISPPPVAVPTSTKPVPDSSPSSPVSPTNSTPLPYVTRSGRRVALTLVTSNSSTCCTIRGGSTVAILLLPSTRAVKIIKNHCSTNLLYIVFFRVENKKMVLTMMVLNVWM
ncbi:uncharacterized protein TNCT_550401 [Trichonephila clavata]|uniref:Uncharacterized protein n=1 Tax=Trichonephila clavata TaxID=2740835 RepID=A0A8X6LLD7_TRICU|nr:uncharacterized protein TNCT_550401 [Trichonephila clavata]